MDLQKYFREKRMIPNPQPRSSTIPASQFTLEEEFHLFEEDTQNELHHLKIMQQTLAAQVHAVQQQIYAVFGPQQAPIEIDHQGRERAIPFPKG